MRLKLEFPEPPIFSVEMNVRVDDINYAGHVGNDRYLTIAHEARIQFFRALGYDDESSLLDNMGIIVSDAALIYKSELFLGDKLQIDLSISDRNKFGFDLFYRIIKIADNKISAIAKTRIFGYDYVKARITEFPEDFFQRVEKLK